MSTSADVMRILVGSLVILLLLFLAMLAWMLTVLKKMQESNNLLVKGQTSLLQQSINLLSTKDPLAYQMVQAVNQPSLSDDTLLDMSDEAEAERYVQTHGQGFFAQDLGINYDAIQQDFPILRDAP